MDVIAEALDARSRPTVEEQQRAADAWLFSDRTRDERLLSFDRWVRRELETRLDWAWAGDRKERRIEQCRIQLESMVRELWRRGWMLDGRKLAARITELLDTVGKYQRAGKVDDFWSYFSAAVKRYVGANAEEIQAEAMRAGNHLGSTLAGLLQRSGPVVATIPELVAQRADEITKAKTLREKLAHARARSKESDRQINLF